MIWITKFKTIQIIRYWKIKSVDIFETKGRARDCFAATFRCGPSCGRFDAFWCGIGCGRLNDCLVLHHFHPLGSSGLCVFQAHLAARKCFGCRLLALGRVQNRCNLLRLWQPDEQCSDEISYVYRHVISNNGDPCHKIPRNDEHVYETLSTNKTARKLLIHFE